MGMYNEAFKKCPQCPGTGYMQIKPQIVLGFGGFDLDNPSSLEQLDVEGLLQLQSAIYDDYFVCQNCQASFRLADPREAVEKQKLIAEITSKTPIRY